MTEPEERDKGFQVRDRRRFTEEGELRQSSSGGEEERAAEESAPQAPPESDAAKAGPSPDAGGPGVFPPHEGHDGPIEITMTTFLMSLSTQALMLLGDFPNPMTGETEADLPGAQEVIALIGMLKEKTRGNLDPAETRLIDKILFDLRMRYVEKVRK